MISVVDLARVRAAADLVAIAGEHTQLKRVGRQWMATCPFHEEEAGRQGCVLRGCRCYENVYP